MKLRATTRIRNDTLISAREKEGLSQRAFAEKYGIAFWLLIRLEKLVYPKEFNEDVLLKISAKLGIPADEIWPEVLTGKTIETTYVKKKEVHADLLLSAIENREQHLLVASPEELAEKAEIKKAISILLDTLSDKERQIIKLRFGLKDGYCYTPEECGRIFKVSCERIRQVEARAIRKLQARLFPARGKDMGLAATWT